MEQQRATARRLGTRPALAVVLVLALAGFYTLGLHDYVSWDYLRGHLDQLQAQVRAEPVQAVVLFFLAFVVLTGLSLPVAGVMMLAAGALFGRWVGCGVVLGASVLGATLAFLVSRYLLRDWVRRRFGEHVAVFTQASDADGVAYLLTLRLVPVFPFFLINLCMGLTAMRPLTFARVTLLGMVPCCFLFANAGTHLAAIEKPLDVLSPGVMLSLGLLGTVPLVFKMLLGRKRTDADRRG
jgi:uncharacterized membrane protein YdjX (TVP38/TMEM64 family)